jgi:hypothetical protein
MPAATPAGPADHNHQHHARSNLGRDRHGRRERRTPSKRSGPRYIVGPPTTIPMSGDDYDYAVRAWAVLIAAWRSEHPPDDESQPDNERTRQTGST